LIDSNPLFCKGLSLSTPLPLPTFFPPGAQEPTDFFRAWRRPCKSLQNRQLKIVWGVAAVARRVQWGKATGSQGSRGPVVQRPFGADGNRRMGGMVPLRQPAERGCFPESGPRASSGEVGSPAEAPRMLEDSCSPPSSETSFHGRRREESRPQGSPGIQEWRDPGPALREGCTARSGPVVTRAAPKGAAFVFGCASENVHLLIGTIFLRGRDRVGIPGQKAYARSCTRFEADARVTISRR